MSGIDDRHPSGYYRHSPTSSHAYEGGPHPYEHYPPPYPEHDGYGRPGSPRVDHGGYDPYGYHSGYGMPGPYRHHDYPPPPPEYRSYQHWGPPPPPPPPSGDYPDDVVHPSRTPEYHPGHSMHPSHQDYPYPLLPHHHVYPEDSGAPGHERANHEGGGTCSPPLSPRYGPGYHHQHAPPPPAHGHHHRAGPPPSQPPPHHHHHQPPPPPPHQQSAHSMPGSAPASTAHTNKRKGALKNHTPHAWLDRAGPASAYEDDMASHQRRQRAKKPPPSTSASIRVRLKPPRPPSSRPETPSMEPSEHARGAHDHMDGLDGDGSAGGRTAKDMEYDRLEELLSLDAVLVAESDDDVDACDYADYEQWLVSIDAALVASGELSELETWQRKRAQALVEAERKSKKRKWLIDNIVSDISSDEDESDTLEPVLTDVQYRAMLSAHKFAKRRRLKYTQNRHKYKKYRRYHETLLNDCLSQLNKKRRHTVNATRHADSLDVIGGDLDDFDALLSYRGAGSGYEIYSAPVVKEKQEAEEDEPERTSTEATRDNEALAAVKSPDAPTPTPSQRKPQKKKPVEDEETIARRKAEADEERWRRQWAIITKRDIPRAYRQLVTNHNNHVNNAKKYAQLCQKEILARLDVRKAGQKAARSTKETTLRARRVVKEMLAYWRRHEKEERENRKRAEREALERQKIEDEMREAKRQQRKLNFLITQTELYAHFIAKNIGAEDKGVSEADILGQLSTGDRATGAGEVDILGDDDEDEESLRERARRQAQEALKSQQDRTRAFDEQAKRTGTKSAQAVSLEDLDNQMNFSDVSTLKEVLDQPRSFVGNLKSYQLKGMSWLVNLYEQGINGILADEMGLGKTVQTVALLSYLADNYGIWGPFLIVAPLSTVHNWQQELAKFNPSLKVLPYWGTPQQRKVIRKEWTIKQVHNKDATFHVLITSYNFVVQDSSYFSRVNWQYMVLDEAQAIKSSSSTRWKTLLSMNCRNRLLLTGTPIQNSMAELWALLHFIMPTLFDSHEEFNEWFSKDIESHAENKSGLDQTQLKRLHMILKPFMLRRLKRHVQNELGEKIEIEIECELSVRQRRLYEGLRQKITLEDLLTANNTTSKTASEQMNKHLMNLVMQFRKVCNHPNLFERRMVESPHNFIDMPPQPSPEEEIEGSSGRRHFELDVVQACRSPVSVGLAKLLFNELVPGTHVSTAAYVARKYFDLHSAAHINECAQDPQNDSYAVVRLAGLTPGEASVAMCGTLPVRGLLWLLSMDRLRRRDMAATAAETDRPALVLTRNNLDTEGLEVSKELVAVSTKYFCDTKYPHVQLNRYMPKAVAPPPELVCSSAAAPTRQRALNTVVSPWQRLVLLGRTAYDEEAWRDLSNADVQEKPWWEPFDSPPVCVSVSGALVPQHAAEVVVPQKGILGAATPPRGWSMVLVPDKYSIILESDKMMRLDQLLTKLKAEGHRVLIYSQMTKMIDLLEEYMQLRRHKYMRLDGSSKVEERRDMVADFQTSGDIFAFLLSTRAGGLGINLTAADTVVFYDSDWNPTNDQQAMDRAHRVGQTRQVTVYRLVTKGTIEERILQRAKQKSEIQAMVISGGSIKHRQSVSDAPKPSEVVSLLLDDKDMEEKLRAQREAKKKQEREQKEKEKMKKKESRLAEQQRRREDAARKRREAREAARASKKQPARKRRVNKKEDGGDSRPVTPLVTSGDQPTGGTKSKASKRAKPSAASARPVSSSPGSSAIAPESATPKSPLSAPANITVLVTDATEPAPTERKDPTPAAEV